jgi:hypothetical protein
LAALGCAAALAAPPATAAGTVEVSWVQPERFIDIGRKTWEREETLKLLGEHFKQLGRQLPDGQTLKIDVLEVDLAGELEPGTGRDLRVLHGHADGPRVTLRYSLQQGAQVLKAGEEELTDQNYFQGSLRANTQSNADLAYERNMLVKWFGQTFGAP